MGYFSSVDAEIRDMIAEGYSEEAVTRHFGLTPAEVAHYFAADDEVYPEERDYQYDDSMDGDFDSAMASAGFGTDEDYIGYSCEEY